MANVRIEGGCVKRFSWLSVAIMLGLCSLAFGQNPNVTLTGTIQGPNGLPVANTVISLTPTQSFFVAGLGSNGCNGYNLAVNASPLTCGDLVNFNDTTPAAPGGSTNIHWQVSTIGGEDFVSAYATGGVSGSGTINTIPIWTSSSALGNSTISLTSGTPNTYSTPDFMQIGFGLVTTSSSLPGPALVAEAVPSFTGTGGGSIIGATIQAQDSSAGNPSATVSSLIGAQITAAASTSGTGQTATVGTIYGVLSTAKAPARANVTTLRGGYFSAQTGSGSATVTNFRGIEAFNNYIGTGTVTNGEGLFVGSPSVNGTITHQYGIYVDDQTVSGFGINSEPHGIYVAGGGIQHKATAFNALPTCAAAYEGTIWAVTNSTTATWGAIIAGGGTNHVLAYCDGTNWTVAAQ